MGRLNGSTSADVSCANPLRRVIEALEVGDVLPALSTLMGGCFVAFAQYRAYLNSFGGADIPSVAAGGVKPDTAQAKHFDAPRVFLFRARN